MFLVLPISLTQNNNNKNNNILYYTYRSLADPGGGAPGARPPNGRGPMIFLCPKR